MIWYGLCEEFSWSEVNKPICTFCFLLTFPSRKYTFLIISPKWKVHPPFIDTWPVFKVDAYSQNRNCTHIQLLLSEDCSTDIDEEANKKYIFAKEMQRWERDRDIWYLVSFSYRISCISCSGSSAELTKMHSSIE